METNASRITLDISSILYTNFSIFPILVLFCGYLFSASVFFEIMSHTFFSHKKMLSFLLSIIVLNFWQKFLLYCSIEDCNISSLSTRFESFKFVSRRCFWQVFSWFKLILRNLDNFERIFWERPWEIKLKGKHQLSDLFLTLLQFLSSQFSWKTFHFWPKFFFNNLWTLNKLQK